MYKDCICFYTDLYGFYYNKKQIKNASTYPPKPSPKYAKYPPNPPQNTLFSPLFLSGDGTTSTLTVGKQRMLNFQRKNEFTVPPSTQG